MVDWKYVVVALVAAGVGAAALGAFQGGDNVATETVTATTTTGTSDLQATLTEEEIDGILWVREEEKLARDVYLTLYDMWGLQIFANIAESEQRHMDAMLRIIETYGLEDPAQDEIGVFTNPQLQELYNQLVEWGSQSLVDAILVGAYIEEVDIQDLQRLINITDNPDVVQTYQNLMGGSMNHLRAFAAEYERLTGEPYQAQVLPPEMVAEILAQPMPGGNAGNWTN